MYGKVIVFTMILPANSWEFFHAVQYQLACLKNLIEYIFKKISEIDEFILNYEGTFSKYFIDTFK